MKAETVRNTQEILANDILKKIYQVPVPLFDVTPTLLHHQKNEQCNCTCSLRQKNKMMTHLEDSFEDLEYLCNEVKLKVHQILVVCSELLEMAQKIPSVAVTGKFIDMRVDLAPAIVRIAAKLQDYHNDPLSVTQKDIERDVLLVADHNFS